MRTLFSLLVLIVMTGFTTARAQSAPPLPPPGRLIDVGGWKLHLDCTGEPRATQPVVILESGVGDFSVEWSLVQPEVAQFARVCSYDRAGDGWSEMGPFPRTYRQVVYELHALLDSARERRPFVLVGHSYGGWLVRTYAMTYPADVAGIVLVEGGAADPLRMMPDGRVVHSSTLVSARSVPPIKTTPLREADIPPAALAQIKAGLAEASAHANDPPRDKLPADAQRMRTWALGTVAHVVAAQNPFENEELALLRGESAKSAHPLGDTPLIVITRGRAEETGSDARALEEAHRADHAAIAGFSTRGRLIVAEKSGHHVQIEQPDLVVDAIKQVVQSTRP